jgi:hypothetical protein
VLAVYVRALLGFYRRRARQQGVADGRGGAVTALQRFGSALNVNVHFHTLLLDGVFTTTADGTLHFHPAPPPSDDEIARLLATIRTRVHRLLARRGLDVEDPSATPVDPLAEESLALAGLTSASVQGRVALGPRAGARVRQIGREPDAPWVTSSGPRQAHLEGFDLHANLAVRADDREGLERLCRYILRPPVAQDRLQLTGDGRIVVALKGEWADGTTHLLFEPIEFLEKLAALIPRPRINLLLYHGILAPHARWRRRAVARTGAAGSAAETVPAVAHTPACPGADAEALSVPLPPGPAPADPAPAASPPPVANTPRHWTWANLMRRAFELDVLACPRCGGRMALIATIEEPDVVRKILRHLGLPTEIPQPRPPPASAHFFSDAHA